ncbi:MAG TPA: 3-hydroxyacyl-CoA dehydrogenase family protein [Syntrophomonadaceae bacterium]|jgi:3-hydroxybutyryl-CoA dehydrogenase|nr:3-hydroxyacyl-CoA dehydrogenase family protein [Syntrophomonadaceae bacterium]HRX20520.1 3-hydroxyacyl-CoA dehydrogenase family protein [Syntrophomonadaceae bacterium]
MNDKVQVLVIGAGIMGHSIAQDFAAHGYPTTLYDQSGEQLETARKLVDGNLQLLKDEGMITDEGIKNVNELLVYTDKMEDAARQAKFVVEAVPEVPDIKQALFAELDRLCSPDTILTSTTSALNIYDVVQVSNPGRLIIGHFCNPAHIIPLVEIVLGPETSPETLEFAKKVYESLDHVPVVLKQYTIGFIVNRLNTALAREANYIVEQGWASPEDVDKAITNNAGLKLAFEGPLELYDHIGWDLAKLGGTFLAPMLCNTTATALPDKMVAEGNLGVKTGKGLKDYTGLDRVKVQNDRNRKILKVLRMVKHF